MYGSSYNYGSRILDSRNTPVEILEYGPMADISALHLQSASYNVVVF